VSTGRANEIPFFNDNNLDRFMRNNYNVLFAKEEIQKGLCPPPLKKMEFSSAAGYSHGVVSLYVLESDEGKTRVDGFVFLFPPLPFRRLFANFEISLMSMRRESSL
jgi:hypothetical protein